MSADRETTRLVRSWLEEGVTALPDRVLDAVLDQVPATPQRRSWWPPRRFAQVNKYAQAAIAAAAVLVVAVVGYNILPSIGGPGGPQTPAPSTAVATPTAEPSDDASVGFLPEGPLVLTSPAGGPSLTVTIPAPGWYSLPQFGVLVKNENGDPPDGAGMIGPFFGDLYVYGDPCHWLTTMPATPATTVDEVVTALTAQASRDASAPVDITVDGHAGKSITLHVPDDAATREEAFRECDQQTFASWAGGGDPVSAGPSRYHQGPGQIDEVWIVDVDGQLIVIDAMYGKATPAGDLAELHQILESIEFGP